MNPADLVPPQDLDAERDVLASLLAIGNGIGSRPAGEGVMEALLPDDLYLERHRNIYRAILELSRQGVPFGPTMVVGQLDQDGVLEEAGGRAYVRELATIAPATVTAPALAKRLRGLAVKRHAIGRLGMLNKLAWNGESAGEVVSAFEVAALEVAARLERGDSSAGAWSAEDAVADLEAELANPPNSPGLATPFPRCLRPLQPGRLYVLGGYSKDGKTAVALQFARAACQAAARVGFVTLEMSRRDLRDRIVASFGVPYRQLLDRRVLESFRPALEHALGELRGWPLTIVDDVRSPASVARLQRLRRFDLLIVDHLHRFSWESGRDLRPQVEDAVRSMTQIALDQAVPVLVLAQFHRPHGRDDFPRPTMQSFRESGVIEQEASAAWAVFRKRDNGQRTEDAELLVMANRYGPDGSYDLQFRPDEVRFVEVQPA